MAQLMPQPTREGGNANLCGQNIGFLGGLALLTNNILGSGMVSIVSVYRRAGWFLPTLAFVLVGLLTLISGLFMARTISKVTVLVRVHCVRACVCECTSCIYVHKSLCARTTHHRLKTTPS
jgi:hypothetical protein